MADALLAHVARNLSTSADDASSRILLSRLEAGDFEAVLRHERVESLLVDATDDAASWTSTVSDRLDQTVGRDPTACVADEKVVCASAAVIPAVHSHGTSKSEAKRS